MYLYLSMQCWSRGEGGWGVFEGAIGLPASLRGHSRLALLTLLSHEGRETPPTT